MEIHSTRASRRRSAGIWAIAALVVLVGAALAIMRPRNDAANASDAGTAQTAQTFRTVSVPVEGMTCIVCASSVKRRAEAIDGATGAEVDLAGKRATVSFVEGRTSPERIAAEIVRLGYKTGAPVIEQSR